MAAKNEAKIKFIAETTEFNEQIKKANQSMSELRSELKLSESQFKDNEKSVEALSEKKRLLQQQLEASGDKVEALRQKLQKAKDIYGENSDEVSKLKTQLNNAERQYTDLENAIEDTNRDLDDADPKTKAAKDALEDLANATDKSNDGFTVMKGVIADLVSEGFQLLIEGAKEAAKYVLQTGMDFEAGMSQVEAVSGASAQEMVQLEDKAKQMGATTKFSATEAAEAFNYMAMAGWKTGDMLGGIEGIMNLAAAANADLGTASDIVTDALTALGYAAKDAGQLADVMAAAASNANTNVELMGYTFKYAAPVAGALGYSMEDLAITTGLMANAGIKGEQAGTTMRAAISNLISPLGTAAKAMQGLGFYTEEVVTEFDQQKIDQQMLKVEKSTLKVDKAQTSLNTAISKYGKDSDEAAQKAIELGIAKEELRIATEKLTVLQKGEEDVIYGVNEAVQNQDGSMKSLRDTLVYLREKFADMSEAEQAAAASAIFGKDAMSGMLAVINASDEDFDKLTLAIDDSEGSAKKMAETMQDNLKGDLEQLGGALETVGLTAYDGFSQPMRQAVQDVTETMSSYDVAKLVNGISYEIGNLAQGLADKLPGAINGVVGFLQTLVDNIDAISNGVKTFITTWAILKGLSIAVSIGGIIAKVASLVSGLVAGTVTIGGVTAALGGMSAAMAAATGGISLVVAGIAFLATKLLDGKSKSNEFSDSFLRSANTLTEFQWGLDNLQPSLSGLSEAAQESMSKLDEAITMTEKRITQVMTDELGNQKELRDQDLIAIANYHNEILRMKQEQLELQRQQQNIELDQLKRKLEKEGTLTQEAASQAIVDAKAAYQASAAATEEAYNAEYARLYAHYESLGMLDSEEYDRAITNLETKIATEREKNEAAKNETIRIAMEESAQWISTDADKWANLANNADLGKKEYKSIMQELNIENSKAFMEMVSTAQSEGVELTDETKEIARNMLGAFDNMPKSMEESGKEALLGMISGIEGQIDGLENASEMSVDEILSTLEKGLGLSGSKSETYAIGQDVSLGLSKGIGAEQDKVDTAASKVAKNTLGTFEDEFEINSPSRAMKRTGQYLVEGLSGGIESKSSWLTTKLSNFANGVKNKINNLFGVQSPSRVTAETGKFLAMGLGVGISENEDAAVKPMQGIVDKIAGIDVAGEWGKLSGASGSLSYDVSAQLGDYVSSAIDSNSPYALLASLIDAVEDLASRPIDLNIDGHRFATATAGATDNVSGNRLNLMNRGLAL